MIQPLFPDTRIVVGAPLIGTFDRRPVLLEMRDSNGARALEIVARLNALDNLVREVSVPIRVTRWNQTTYRFWFLVDVFDFDPQLYVQRALLAA
jgi:hypothetical protein